jgi:hypothetical protein
VEITAAKKINEILDSLRRHFAKSEMKQLAELVASFEVTRSTF